MRKIFPCALYVALILNGMIGFFPAVSAASEANLYIDPPSIKDTAYTPSKTFTISIVVANVTELYSLEVNMSFDSGTLGYRGHFVDAQEYSPKSKWKVDDNLGFIWLNITYGSPISSTAPIKLANVTFSVRALGATPLDLNSTSLINSVGEPIPHVVSNGFFSNFNPYDLNTDGKIDIRDVTIVAIAFGSYPGHPRWNPNADLNKDGTVDIRDIALIAAHFGQY